MLQLVQVGLDTWQVVYMDSNSQVCILKKHVQAYSPIFCARCIFGICYGWFLSALVLPYAEISTVAFILCDCDEFQS